MPQSVYPLPLQDTEEVDVSIQTTTEEILEAGERIAKQLATITGLDLEKGDL